MSNEAVLNLWAADSLGLKRPFHRGFLKPSGNTDVYSMIHKSSKVSYDVPMKIILWLGVPTTRQNTEGLKDHRTRRVENHWSNI